MLYVRFSMMHAAAGKEGEVAAIMDDLVSYYAKQKGYINGYKLSSTDELGSIGRFTVWKSIEDADHAAQTDHVLARRSDLLPLIDEGSHEEHSFHAEEESRLLALLLHKLRG